MGRMTTEQASKLEVPKELLSLVDRLVNDGLVERFEDTLVLTKKGRTEALLRWRGLSEDIKVLIALWFREELQNETKGEI